MLDKADKIIEEHNFKHNKSLYEESLEIKDNKEILAKLDLIKTTENSLEKLETVEPLVQENKFDEATEILNKIDSSSEYVSSKC